MEALPELPDPEEAELPLEEEAEELLFLEELFLEELLLAELVFAEEPERSEAVSLEEELLAEPELFEEEAVWGSDFLSSSVWDLEAFFAVSLVWEDPSCSCDVFSPFAFCCLSVSAGTDSERSEVSALFVLPVTECPAVSGLLPHTVRTPAVRQKAISKEKILYFIWCMLLCI